MTVVAAAIRDPRVRTRCATVRGGRPPRSPREDDTEVDRPDHSDIHRSGRSDDSATVHLRETADHEVRAEISPGPSHSHRTRRQEGAILRLTTVSLYRCLIIVEMFFPVTEEGDREKDRGDTEDPVRAAADQRHQVHPDPWGTGATALLQIEGGGRR